jgi:hypothetical protein
VVKHMISEEISNKYLTRQHGWSTVGPQRMPREGAAKYEVTGPERIAF